MKSTNEIEEQVRTLLVEELQRRLNREVLPHLCVHNHRQPLDHRKSIYGEPNVSYNRISAAVEDGVSLPVVQTIGLCMLDADPPEEWRGTICDEPLDAQRCPFFVHRQSRVDVYNEFVGNLRDPKWVELHLPAVHSLLWVIGASLGLSEGVSTLYRFWMKVTFGLFEPPSEKSQDVLVYLPPLDAFHEDRPRTPADN